MCTTVCRIILGCGGMASKKNLKTNNVETKIYDVNNFVLNIEKLTNKEIPEHLRLEIESEISNASSELLESSVFDNLLEIGGELKSILIVYSEIEPAGAYRLTEEGKYLLNLNELKKYLAGVKEKFSDSETPVDYQEFHNCIKNKMMIPITISSI